MDGIAFLMDFWGMTMWRACWQGGLLVSLVWLACTFIPQMPARFQCWFWRLALLKFAVIVVFPFSVQLPLLPAPMRATELVYAEGVSSVAVNPPSLSHQGFSNESDISIAPTTIVVLFLGWVTGAAWSLWQLFNAGRKVVDIRSQYHAVEDKRLIGLLESQCASFGVWKAPLLLEVEGNGSPMLVGIAKPCIVIPTDTCLSLSDAEQELVLGHELAHLKRLDLIWSLFASIIRSLFFFHPLVWLCERRLLVAKEIAADELAVVRQSGDPVCYGKLLVSIVSKIGPDQITLKSSLGVMCPLESLTKRLSAMKYFCRTSRPVLSGSIVLFGLTVVLCGIPWEVVAAEPDNENGGIVQTGEGVAILPDAIQTEVTIAKPSKDKDGHLSVRVSDIENFFLMRAVNADPESAVAATKVTCNSGQRVGIIGTQIPSADEYRMSFCPTVAENGQSISLSVDAPSASVFSSHANSTINVSAKETVLFAARRTNVITSFALVTPEVHTKDKKGMRKVSLEVRYCDVGEKFIERIGIDFDHGTGVDATSRQR